MVGLTSFLTRWRCASLRNCWVSKKKKYLQGAWPHTWAGRFCWCALNRNLKFESVCAPLSLLFTFRVRMATVEMSSDELRAQLYTSLRGKGILDSLKVSSYTHSKLSFTTTTAYTQPVTAENKTSHRVAELFWSRISSSCRL